MVQRVKIKAMIPKEKEILDFIEEKYDELKKLLFEQQYFIITIIVYYCSEFCKHE